MTSRTFFSSLSGLLRRPFAELGYAWAAVLLARLMRLRGQPDFDSLLKIAECELYLDRGRQQSALTTVRDFVRRSNPSQICSIPEKGGSYAQQGEFTRVLIVFHVWSDVFDITQISHNSAAQWMVHQIEQIAEVSEIMIRNGGKMRDIAVKHGLSKMEEMLKRLRDMRIADKELSASSEANALLQLARIYRFTKEDKKPESTHNTDTELAAILFGS